MTCIFKRRFLTIPLVFALSAATAAFGQDLAKSQSGPFWEHPITARSEASICSVTVDGSLVRDPRATDRDDSSGYDPPYCERPRFRCAGKTSCRFLSN